MRWTIIIHRAPSPCPGAETEGLRLALQLAPALTEETQVIACALEKERPVWGPLLEGFEGLRLVEEPFERGTATGLAVALGRVAMTDRKADVVVMESTRPPASRVGALHSMRMLQRKRSGRPHDVVAEGGLALGSTTAWLSLLAEVAPELESLAHDERHLFELDPRYPFLSALDYRHQVLRYALPVLRPESPTLVDRFFAAV